MIRYTLICDKAHEFEGWFANSSAYDAQRAKGLVECPNCGSSNVSKAPMAPNISRSGKNTGHDDGLVDAIRRVRKHVEENSDYVGDRFASEARKIHYQETEPRGIYGEATIKEADELREEGVEFHPLPKLPEEQN